MIPADLGDKAALAKIEAVLRDDASITLLVNNAGTASLAPLLNSDVDQMEAMVALNVTALTRLTYAAAPAFVARGAGTPAGSEFLATQKKWDAAAFVDLCEKAASGSDALALLCRRAA